MAFVPLDPEQALDEATHRKVEGAFDELQRAARNIEREAAAIEEEGGEQRLADLLRSVSGELRETLKRTMASAYYRAESQDEATPPDPPPVAPARAEETERDQVSLFEEAGDDALAA
jgi:sugar-specific transcriptional regulator TrmB